MPAFRMNPLVLSIPALVASAFVTAGAVAQQMQSVPAYWAVTGQNAVVRSGDSERFYKIADIPAGTFLRVDGESQVWSRVTFPSKVYCVVRVEDVKVEGSNLRVTQPTKLRALNAVGGYVGSWKSVLDLPADATLKMVKEEREGDGPVVGYRVEAPESARAFVESRVLRRASDSEVQAYLARSGQPAGQPTNQPTSPSTTPVQPSTQPTAPSATPAVGQPTAPGTSTPTAPAGTAPTIDLTQPTAPGTPPAETTPATTTPPSETPQPVPVIEDTQATQQISKLAQLDETFREVWGQPVLTAELDEIKAEYQKYIDSLGDSMPKTRERLEQRIKAIEVRQQFRETVRKMEDDRAKVESQKSEIQKLVQDWEARRVYTIVGELQPSTVYDGKRLPQMFRVTSVGGPSRTLGYIKSDEKFQLERMVGTVVGVIGEAELDRSLKLNVITPVRVDQLKGVSRPQ